MTRFVVHSKHATLVGGYGQKKAELDGKLVKEFRYGSEFPFLERVWRFGTLGKRRCETTRHSDTVQILGNGDTFCS